MLDYLAYFLGDVHGGFALGPMADARVDRRAWGMRIWMCFAGVAQCFYPR
jgi:hypothetical protein